MWNIFLNKSSIKKADTLDIIKVTRLLSNKVPYAKYNDRGRKFKKEKIYGFRREKIYRDSSEEESKYTRDREKNGTMKNKYL